MRVKTKINDYIQLYNLPFEELVTIAKKITKQNFNNEVEFCSIISAKTGECTENCKYCAQSSHYRTNIETHPLLTLEEVEASAINARENGATRFSIVTSGKTPENKELDTLAEMIQIISNIEGLSACASLGILNEEQAEIFSSVGLKRYHHNLNACKSYYNNVCTTHLYEERLRTIEIAWEYGFEICAGGIIGMGESKEQRIEMALELSELDPHSVPINILCPIEGTPFETYSNDIDEEEILRTMAIYRIIMPEKILRYGGGRALRLSPENQELGLQIGINGIIIGNLLTTTGVSPEQDRDMLKNAGMRLKK